MNNSTKADMLAVAMLLAVVIALCGLGAVMLHGKVQDFSKDAMHDNCWKCTVYRWMNNSNAAFEIREARRKHRAYYESPQD